MSDGKAAAPRRHCWPRRAKFAALGLSILIAGLALAGCGGSSSSEGYEEPAVVDTSGETARLTLTAKAAERLGIELASVEESGGARSIPYAAVLYEPDGTTWAYTNPDELVYVRASIEVERIVEDTAFLTDGPAPGTDVVTVGVAELWGTELGLE